MGGINMILSETNIKEDKDMRHAFNLIGRYKDYLNNEFIDEILKMKKRI